MKTPKLKSYLFRILPALLLILSGLQVYAGHGGVVAFIKKANTPFNDEERVESLPSLAGNTVLVKTKYQGGIFRTETRKDKGRAL